MILTKVDELHSGNDYFDNCAEVFIDEHSAYNRIAMDEYIRVRRRGIVTWHLNRAHYRKPFKLNPNHIGVYRQLEEARIHAKKEDAV